MDFVHLVLKQFRELVFFLKSSEKVRRHLPSQARIVPENRWILSPGLAILSDFILEIISNVSRDDVYNNSRFRVFLQSSKTHVKLFSGQVLIAPNSSLIDLLEFILCCHFDSIAQCFPDFFARGTLWFRKITADPHIIDRANIQYPDDRNPKLKMHIWELISDSFEYITVTHVAMHCMIRLYLSRFSFASWLLGFLN